MVQSGSIVNDRHLSDWVFQWGQWITHDLDLTNNGPQYNQLSIGEAGDFRIPVLDPDDPSGPTRSRSTASSTTRRPARRTLSPVPSRTSTVAR